MNPIEQNIVVYIGIYKALGLVATVIGGAWFISRKLTRVETKVDNCENQITNLTGRLDNLYASSSPITLLKKGTTILEDSGLKKYIDEKKEELLSQCKSKSNMDNQYNIQEAAFKFFDQLNFGDFETKLKAAAFKHGVNMETIRRIGGIYFRDICLNDKGFRPEDLDKPKSN